MVRESSLLQAVHGGKASSPVCAPRRPRRHLLLPLAGPPRPAPSRVPGTVPGHLLAGCRLPEQRAVMPAAQGAFVAGECMCVAATERAAAAAAAMTILLVMSMHDYWHFHDDNMHACHACAAALVPLTAAALLGSWAVRDRLVACCPWPAAPCCCCCCSRPPSASDCVSSPPSNLTMPPAASLPASISPSPLLSSPGQLLPPLPPPGGCSCLLAAAAAGGALSATCCMLLAGRLRWRPSL